MGAREDEMTRRGWRQVGAGHWAHPQVESGDERFSFEAAVNIELSRDTFRTQERIDALAKVLDEIKVAFDLKCDYDRIPAALVSRFSTVPERASERVSKYLDKDGAVVEVRQKSTHHDGCACQSCDPKGERVPRPLCPDCEVPMTFTSDALGKNRKLMCESCGRTVSGGENVTKEELVAAAERRPVEDENQRLVPRRVPQTLSVKTKKELEGMRVDMAAHERAIGIVVNFILRAFEEPGKQAYLDRDELEELKKWKG